MSVHKSGLKTKGWVLQQMCPRLKLTGSSGDDGADEAANRDVSEERRPDLSRLFFCPPPVLTQGRACPAGPEL